MEQFRAFGIILTPDSAELGVTAQGSPRTLQGWSTRYLDKVEEIAFNLSKIVHRAQIIPMSGQERRAFCINMKHKNWSGSILRPKQ